MPDEDDCKTESNIPITLCLNKELAVVDSDCLTLQMSTPKRQLDQLRGLLAPIKETFCRLLNANTNSASETALYGGFYTISVYNQSKGLQNLLYFARNYNLVHLKNLICSLHSQWNSLSEARK